MNLPSPVIEAITDNLYVLVQDYLLTHKKYHFCVKKGFKTDGASIPRIFWRITGQPMQGLALPAAVIHDALYGSELLPREVNDKIFYELLRRNGEGWWKAWWFYKAVRISGWTTYSTHTEKTRAYARQFITVAESAK